MAFFTRRKLISTVNANICVEDTHGCYTNLHFMNYFIIYKIKQVYDILIASKIGREILNAYTNFKLSQTLIMLT